MADFISSDWRLRQYHDWIGHVRAAVMRTLLEIGYEGYPARNLFRGKSG